MSTSKHEQSLKSSQSSNTPITNSNDIFLLNNTLKINQLACSKNQLITKVINITSIVIISLIGVLIIGLIIYLIFIKKIYKENLAFIFKYYTTPFFVFSVVVMLLINTTIMANLNGLNSTFILNVTSLCFLVLPIIITYIFNIYNNSHYNLT